MATGTTRDYYEVLGVARTADVSEIKQAYRRLAVQYHPDRNPGDPTAEERFKEASEAYAVLSDVENRARYDRFGHQGVGGGFSGFDVDHFGDFADILGDLFGFGFGDICGGRRRRAHNVPRRGRDLQYTLQLGLEEAATGVERTLRIPRSEGCKTCGGSGAEPGTQPERCGTCGGQGQVMFRRGFLSVAQTCPTCGGGGSVTASPCSACGGRGRAEREASLKVTVPAGIDTGMRLRLAGEGEDGHLGGPRGDLYVVVAVADHDRFVRHGDDLHLAVPVSSFQAMLGTRLAIDTILGDDAELDVPAGAQPEQTIRLKGEGMPRVDGRGSGDLIVHLKVVVPRKLSSEQRRLVQEAARLGDEAVTVDDDPSILQRIKRALTGEE